MNHYRKFMSLLEHWANHGVPQMLCSTLAAIAIGLGSSMFIAPYAYMESFLLRYVFEFASPFAWGTVYIVSSLAVLIGVYTHPRNAQAPLYMLSAAFAVHGLLTIPQIANGGVPQSVFFLIGLAWICIITQLICGVSAKEKNQNAASQTSIHNLSG